MRSLLLGVHNYGSCNQITTNKDRFEKISPGVYPKNEIDFSLIYASFLKSLKKNTGSVLSFLGVARLESADGRTKIKFLVIESYEKHANSVLNKICKEIKGKYDLTNIVIVHALGSFSAGEPVVMVVVASPRRRQGFEALRDAVERYKKEPALFKKEIYRDGTSSWIS